MVYEDLIYLPVLYLEGLVKYIDGCGRQHIAHQLSDVLYRRDITIKIEQMTRVCPDVYRKCQWYQREMSHDGPVTCHLFIAYANSPSFDQHTDPYDVYLEVLSGEKTLVMDGISHRLTPAYVPFRIPAGVPHQAINHHPSLMLSYSTERFLCHEDIVRETH